MNIANDSIDAPAQVVEPVALAKGGDDVFGQGMAVVVHPGGAVRGERALDFAKSLARLETAFNTADDRLLLLRRQNRNTGRGRHRDLAGRHSLDQLRHALLVDLIGSPDAEVGNLHDFGGLLSRFVFFLVFFPWERILAHGRFASLFQSGALSLPSLLFKKRLELGRHEGPLALRQVAAVEVPGNHERQRRAALAGIGAEARRHSPGQATQIAVPPVQHRALAEDDLLLQAVLLDVAAQAVEIRVSHEGEDFGMAMERQTLFGHGCLCPVRQRLPGGERRAARESRGGRAPREKSHTHHLTPLRRGHFSVLPDSGSNASPWIPSSCYLPATRSHFVIDSHCHRLRVLGGLGAVRSEKPQNRCGNAAHWNNRW